MSKLRVLYVASEINPFLQTSEVADFCAQTSTGDAGKRDGDQNSGAEIWDYK
jgi:hypothetical protein